MFQAFDNYSAVRFFLLTRSYPGMNSCVSWKVKENHWMKKPGLEIGSERWHRKMFWWHLFQSDCDYVQCLDLCCSCLLSCHLMRCLRQDSMKCVSSCHVALSGCEWHHCSTHFENNDCLIKFSLLDTSTIVKLLTVCTGMIKKANKHFSR